MRASHIRAVQILAALLPLSISANVPGVPADEGLNAWALPAQEGDQDKTFGPGFNLAHLAIMAIWE